MQADILGILKHTPSLKGHVFADNEGDFNSRLEKSLGTKTVGSTGKRGLAIIVLQVDVLEAEKNLPGPPLKMRARVLVIENIVVNRSATKGTLQRSSQAALNILNTLQLAGCGSYMLYADKGPVSPQTVPEGLSSHMVTLYVQGGMNPLEKPAPVQAAMGSIMTITSGGPLIIDGDVAVAFPPLVPTGTYNGRTNYQGSSEAWPDANLYWTGQVWSLEPDGGSNHWRSFDDVATPDLATTWQTTGNATGTPIVTAGAGALLLSCETPASAIRYTTDGSFPIPTSNLYTAPITGLATGTVVRAAAYVTGQPPGDVLELTVTA